MLNMLLVEPLEMGSLIQGKRSAIFITGEMGTGKSRAARRLIEASLIMGKKTLVFDFNDEYKKMCEFNKGYYCDYIDFLTTDSSKLKKKAGQFCIVKMEHDYASSFHAMVISALIKRLDYFDSVFIEDGGGQMATDQQIYINLLDELVLHNKRPVNLIIITQKNNAIQQIMDNVQLMMMIRVLEFQFPHDESGTKGREFKLMNNGEIGIVPSGLYFSYKDSMDIDPVTYSELELIGKEAELTESVEIIDVRQKDVQFGWTSSIEDKKALVKDEFGKMHWVDIRKLLNIK